MKTTSIVSRITVLFLLPLLCFLTSSLSAQSYLGADGGFEGTATIDNATTNSSAQASKWAKANSNQTIANETGTVRSGSNSLRLNNASTTGARCWSPLITVSATTNVTLQYYRYVANTTNASENQEGIVTSASETLTGTYATGTAGTWTKVTYTRTSSTFTTIAGVIVFRKKGTGGDMFVDDVTMYAGSVDNTAPNTAGTLTISNATTNSLDLSWGAASGGVDNGGYMVVRYTTTPNANNDPNTNGVYAVGNTYNLGTGSLVGTVCYVGTGTSFTDASLNASTTYYYKVYTFDKAYNYAPESEANAATSSSSAPTKLAITSVNGGNGVPVSPSTFSLTIQAQDNTSTAQAVVASTAISLSLATGTGALGGTTTGTITAGTNSVTISGITYNTMESGVRIVASRTSGDVLTRDTTTAFTVFALEPAAQATSMTFSAASNAGFTVGYTAASGSPAGYIVVRKSGAAYSSGVPVDGTTYTAGTTLGDGTVAYVGSGTSFAETTLSANTQYSYSVYSYNGSGAFINYYTTSPLQSQSYTYADEPTTNATNLSFSGIGANTLTLSWTNGNGTRRLVIMKSGSAVDALPVDGTNYIANTTFGSGTQIGTGNYVVYDGTAATSGSISGLSTGGTYYVAIVEYNGTLANNNANFYTTGNLTGSQTTLADYVALSAPGTAIAEDFNTLVNTGTSSTMPAGWFFVETGTSSNTTYTAGTGSSTTGDTYSFGASSASDRAMGSLRSGSVASVFGAKLHNSTGVTITGLLVSYTGEQWRLGTASRKDSLTFQYSANATSLSTGTWVDNTALNFLSPSTTSVGALDGNLNANRTAVTYTLSGLSIANGADFWIRWTDIDASGADDGLAIDDMSITGFANVNKTASSQGSATLSDLNVAGGVTTLTGNVTISGGLYIESGAQLVIGNNTLTLNGTVSGTGTIKGSRSSSLSIGGSDAAGTLYFDQTTPGVTNLLQNFTLNRGTSPASGSALLGNSLILSGTTTLTHGTLTTGSNLTLLSDSLGTARIAAINTTNADISGSVTSQRYIPAVARRYRMISPNTSSFTFSQLIDNIFITGPGGSSKGFENVSNTLATVYLNKQDTPSRGWRGIDSINTSLAAGYGALVFIRGDRTLASPDWYRGPYPSQNAVTLDFAGSINKGTISPALTYTNTNVSADDGWNLVGNPYPCEIDWRSASVTKSQLSPFFYIYNPSTNSYEADDGTTYNIASGQAFFVQAIAAAPSITFTENAKTSGSGTAYFKAAPQRLSIMLGKDSINSDIAWLALKNGASKGFVSNEDASKFFNPSLNLSFNIDQNNVQYNMIPGFSAGADTFALEISAPAGTYTLSADGLSIVPGSQAVLLSDLYTGNIIDLRSAAGYSFNVDAAPASSGMRFLLIITDPSTLPVKLVSFAASRVGSNVELSWKTASEMNMKGYIVERSLDANTFSEVASVAALNKNGSTMYQATDRNIINSVALQGANTIYYRLKNQENNGTFTYSNIALVTLDQKPAEAVAYPNPADKELFIRNSGKIQHINIFDATGMLVATPNVSDHAGLNIDISQLHSGIYLIELTTLNGTKTLRFSKR